VRGPLSEETLKTSRPNKRTLALSTLTVGLGTLIGVSLGACTVSVGDGSGLDFDGGRSDSASPSPSTSSTPPPTGNATCNSCLFQGCSGQHSVCQSNAECLAIYQCATKAGCDQACVNSCFDSHPNGQREYTALYTCDQQRMCASCSSECGVASCAPVDAGPEPTNDAGPAVDSGPTPPLDCSSCTAARCTAEQGACSAGSDCDAYSTCVIASNDAASAAVCGTAHPSGKAASDALAACTGSKCKTECGF